MHKCGPLGHFAPLHVSLFERTYTHNSAFTFYVAKDVVCIYVCFKKYEFDFLAVTAAATDYFSSAWIVFEADT